jgi:tryptophan 2,3-dioxygenase
LGGRIRSRWALGTGYTGRVVDRIGGRRLDETGGSEGLGFLDRHLRKIWEGGRREGGR